MSRVELNVVGFQDPDEDYLKKKVAWDACVAANVSVPEELEDFFRGWPPDERGREIELPIREWSDSRDSMRRGYELSVSDIPAGVKVLRFVADYDG